MAVQTALHPVPIEHVARRESGPVYRDKKNITLTWFRDPNRLALVESLIVPFKTVSAIEKASRH